MDPAHAARLESFALLVVALGAAVPVAALVFSGAAFALTLVVGCAVAGWTRSAKLAVNLPPFVWLTSRGGRLIDSPFRTWDAGIGLTTHIEAVTNFGCYSNASSTSERGSANAHSRDEPPPAPKPPSSP